MHKIFKKRITRQNEFHNVFPSSKLVSKTFWPGSKTFLKPSYFLQKDMQILFTPKIVVFDVSQ